MNKHWKFLIHRVTNQSLLVVTDDVDIFSITPLVTTGVGLPQPKMPNWTFDGIELSFVAKIVISNCVTISTYGS